MHIRRHGTGLSPGASNVKSANDCDCGQFSGFIVRHLMGHAEHLFIHFEHSGTNSYAISGMELTPIVNTLVQRKRSPSFRGTACVSQAQSRK